MRKRIYNWQGQGFVYLGLEGHPGVPAEQQSTDLFARADAELKTLNLSLAHTPALLLVPGLPGSTSARWRYRLPGVAGPSQGR